MGPVNPIYLFLLSAIFLVGGGLLLALRPADPVIVGAVLAGFNTILFFYFHNPPSPTTPAANPPLVQDDGKQIYKPVPETDREGHP